MFEILFAFEVSLYHYEAPSWDCFCFIPSILESCVSIFICLKIFKNTFLFLHWSFGCVVVCCLMSLCLFFPVFSIIDYSFHTQPPQKMVDMILVFLCLLRFVLWPSFLRMLYVHLKRMYNLQIWGGMIICIYLLSVSDMSFQASVSLIVWWSV